MTIIIQNKYFAQKVYDFNKRQQIMITYVYNIT